MSLTLALSLSHTHTNTFTHTQSPTHPLSLSLSISLCLSFPLSLSLSLSLFLTLYLPLSHPHTHSHTHSPAWHARSLVGECAAFYQGVALQKSCLTEEMLTADVGVDGSCFLRPHASHAAILIRGKLFCFIFWQSSLQQESSNNNSKKPLHAAAFFIRWRLARGSHPSRTPLPRPLSPSRGTPIPYTLDPNPCTLRPEPPCMSLVSFSLRLTPSASHPSTSRGLYPERQRRCGVERVNVPANLSTYFFKHGIVKNKLTGLWAN